MFGKKLKSIVKSLPISGSKGNPHVQSSVAVHPAINAVSMANLPSVLLQCNFNLAGRFSWGAFPDESIVDVKNRRQLVAVDYCAPPGTPSGHGLIRVLRLTDGVLLLDHPKYGCHFTWEPWGPRPVLEAEYSLEELELARELKDALDLDLTIPDAIPRSSS